MNHLTSADSSLRPHAWTNVVGPLTFWLASLCVAAGAMAGDLNAGAGGPSVVKVTRDSRVPPTTSLITGSLRYLIPDGSSVYIAWGTETERWFYTEVEPGKTYVIEAMDPYSDFGSSSFNGMGIYELDGTTTPPAETQVACGISSGEGDGLGVEEIAPAILNYAPRCFVRTFFPTASTTLNKRSIYIKLDHFGANNAGQIRIREATIYGRWTTNGYDFHIELQNTTADSMCINVVLYPDKGLTYSGGAFSNLPVHSTTMNVPAYGANKIVIPNGTTVGASADKRGTLRLQSCPSSNFNTDGLHVNTVAYSPTLGQFLLYTPSKARNGVSGSF